MNRFHAFTADLWYGRVPLPQAFWTYAIVYGFFIALFTTIASFSLLAGGYSDALALFFYLLPAPYNFFMVVAVWRSAARYEGPAHWAALARPAVIVWAIVATLA